MVKECLNGTVNMTSITSVPLTQENPPLVKKLITETEKHVTTIATIPPPAGMIRPLVTIAGTQTSVSSSAPMINLTISNGEIRTNQSIPPSVAMVTVTRDFRDISSATTIQKPIIVTVSGAPGTITTNKPQLTTVTNVITTPIVVAPHTSGLSTLPLDKSAVSNIAAANTVLNQTTLRATLPAVPAVANNTSIPVVVVPSNASKSAVLSSSSNNPSQSPLLIVATSSPVSAAVATTVTSSSSGSFPPTLVPVTSVTMSSGLRTSVPLPITVTTPVVAITNHSAPLIPPTLTPVSSQPKSYPVTSVTSSSVSFSNTITTVKTDPCSPDFDPIQAMDWKDGVATLPGSNLKFKINEFGTLEMINEDWTSDLSLQVLNQNTKEEINDISKECKDLDKNQVRSVLVKKIEPKTTTTSDNIKQTVIEVVSVAPVEKPDDICRCENCGCYGLISEFHKSGRFCSQSCMSSYSTKGGEKNKTLLPLKKKKKKQIYTQSSEEPPRKEIKLNVKVEDNTKSSDKTERNNLGFSWTTYLEKEKAVAAPIKQFRDYQSIPTYKNGFKVGMKLEGLDPKHPSMFCVLSVAEVCGFRIRLHFDGYSHCYDFWLNADSIDIFPVGWCEKTGHQLHPPKGFTSQEFNWNHYLQISKAQAAPKHLFACKNLQTVTPHGFRVGMKLEAVDRKDTSLVCVASVTDVMDNRFLIHFDGWDDIYDYWADPTSPYIHPVNWCKETGNVLIPPNNYRDPDRFTWEKYLSETKAQVVPNRAFKRRPPHGFKKDMKLEVVDKRNPMLIRVATIADTQSHAIKIHFDGWSDAYDYWLDDDSPDIHPVSWCTRTGHPLQPPISEMTITNSSGCPTTGCQGIGHIKGPKYTSHHSSFGCPYSQLNMNKETALQDRLGPSKASVIDIAKRQYEWRYSGTIAKIMPQNNSTDVLKYD
ncbi:lethal(3)malignant brain tumor-like protein 3 isoform X1 [Centruroides sculpturatus]|uniref:lethal(3)malignant brain tumor-like protein 3 isoform X1 n=2 Tax=Centruroides sculpturatus TaxID=218467 RepID=UPI000C6EA0A1|nr:lethal(3)malignant brain tumor-like protein 3 isoform X1 [Centruroides sculpturatus]